MELKGEKGIPSSVDGLFDGGAMINSICNRVFPILQSTLGTLVPSMKTLRMADRTRVPSQGRWSGDVTLGGRTVKGSFEVFPSCGSWSLLFGKPLLEKFKAIHDYEMDTLKIELNGKWSTLINVCTEPGFARENADVLKGEDNSPLRQVLLSIINNLERADKQTQLESLVNTVTRASIREIKRRPGHQAHNKRKCNTEKHLSQLREWWNAVWTVQDATTEPEAVGDLQPEVEIGGDHSLFS